MRKKSPKVYYHPNQVNDSRPDTSPGLVFRVLILLFFSAGVGYVVSYKMHLGMVPGSAVGASVFGVGFYSLLKLRAAPKELGVTFGLKLFSVTAYKLLIFSLSSWLIKDLGFADAGVGTLILTWGVFMTCANLVVGPLTDVLGLRKTLLAGVTLSVVFRLVMVMATNKWVALFAGMFPLAIGEALCTPVLVAATRLYTNPSQRSVAFSVLYAIMNFGFMLGYFVTDAVDRAIPGEGAFTWAGISFSQHRLIILVSLVVDLLMLPLVYFLKSGVQMTDSGFVQIHQAHAEKTGNLLSRIMETIQETIHDTGAALAHLFRSKGIGKLLVFLLMIGLLKIVFNIMDYVLKPFSLREIGASAGDHIGSVNAINGLLILILAPLVGNLTRKYSSYSMVILGGFITAFSFVFMAIPASAFQATAEGWLGNAIGHQFLGITGAVHPYFIMMFFWQIVFSIGEAFYSPRVYEYAASISPPGQEAAYSSLSYVPQLVGKVFVGAMFAGILNRYCPETGPRDPSTLWLLIGLLVFIAPTGLLLLKRFIRVKEEGRES